LKTLKHTLRIGALVLALVLVLAACGGGNGGGGAGLSGTFVYEDGTPGTWTFTGDTFEASVPHSEMDIEELPGEFSIRGTFSVDEDAQTITLSVDEDALKTEAQQLIDALFDQDPELTELMADPDFAEMIEAALEEAFDTMVATLLAEFGDIEWQFEDDFDRIIDDEGSVLVRQ